MAGPGDFGIVSPGSVTRNVVWSMAFPDGAPDPQIAATIINDTSGGGFTFGGVIFYESTTEPSDPSDLPGKRPSAGHKPASCQLGRINGW